MMRKLLLILCLFTVGFSFAQQRNSNRNVHNERFFKKPKTITTVKVTPNPFYEDTKIIFNSTKPQEVIFSVKNLLGKVVYSKQIKVKRGENNIFFQRNKLQSGMYLYSLQTTSEVVVKRLVIR